MPDKPRTLQLGDRVKHMRGAVGTVNGVCSTPGWVTVRWDGSTCARASVMTKTLAKLQSAKKVQGVSDAG